MLPTKPPGEKPAFVRHRVRQLMTHDSTFTSGLDFAIQKTSEVGVFTSPWDLCIDNSLQEDPYFAVGGDTPKVQIPYITIPGQAPRQLVEERLRRGYLILDLLQLLAAKGIRSNNLMPVKPDKQDDSVPKSYKLVSPFLPLEKAGSLWAESKDGVIESLFLHWPCCLLKVHTLSTNGI
ncbi:dynein heavy chain 1, axonemal-like [Xiphophorus maculatus]|uniref:dynein heavy chain 1, axonemal-like n=1 Tax=Xiphophorus maculatus TaxID=8083 RepID=UPI000C6C9FCE|nr:dynein heavy chain 1, axonemal-like [Xiphophorus maculatus]